MPEDTIPAFSMHQPWASLVAHGHKRIETRSRRPPQYVIGQRVAIHATRMIVTFDPEQYPPEDRDLIRAFNDATADALGKDWPLHLPTGAVLATATLASASPVRTRHDLPESHLEILFGEYGLNRWMWFLEDVHKLPDPVPARGYPTFWKWQPPHGTH